MKKDTLVFLVVVFILSLIARLIFFDTSYFIWDETVYLMQGKLAAGTEVGYDELYLRPPLLHSIIAPIWKFFPGQYETFTRFFVTLLNSLIVFPVFYLGNIINRKTGIISAFISALLPVSILHSRYVLTDHLGAILAIITFVLFFVGAKKGKDSFLYLGSIALFLSIITKFTNLLLVILILPLILVILRNKIKVLIRSALIFLAFFIPYMIYNHITYRNALHPFLRAWNAVETSTPVDMFFNFYLLYDIFGIVFLFLGMMGILYFVLHKIVKVKLSKRERIFNSIFIIDFLIITIYSFNIINIGVAKPQGIEWEVERFLLLFTMFCIVIIGFGLNNLAEVIKKRKIRYIALGAVLILGLSLMHVQFSRAYTPQIEYENGLRYTTKDMGLYISSININSIDCLGNCPPIAYYSGKELYMFFNIDKLMDSKSEVIIVFDELDSQDSLSFLKKFCKMDYCAYLYQRS